jgi:hypothetical protein
MEHIDSKLKWKLRLGFTCFVLVPSLVLVRLYELPEYGISLFFLGMQSGLMFMYSKSQTRFEKYALISLMILNAIATIFFWNFFAS